jgi:hypothetical protein
MAIKSSENIDEFCERKTTSPSLILFNSPPGGLKPPGGFVQKQIYPISLKKKRAFARFHSG